MLAALPQWHFLRTEADTAVVTMAASLRSGGFIAMIMWFDSEVTEADPDFHFVQSPQAILIWGRFEKRACCVSLRRHVFCVGHHGLTVSQN